MFFYIFQHCIITFLLDQAARRNIREIMPLKPVFTANKSRNKMRVLMLLYKQNFAYVVFAGRVFQYIICLLLYLPTLQNLKFLPDIIPLDETVLK